MPKEKWRRRPTASFAGRAFFVFFAISAYNIRRAAPILILEPRPGPRIWFLLRLADPPDNFQTPDNFFRGLFFQKQRCVFFQILRPSKNYPASFLSCGLAEGEFFLSHRRRFGKRSCCQLGWGRLRRRLGIRAFFEHLHRGAAAAPTMHSNRTLWNYV